MANGAGRVISAQRGAVNRNVSRQMQLARGEPPSWEPEP